MESELRNELRRTQQYIECIRDPALLGALLGCVVTAVQIELRQHSIERIYKLSSTKPMTNSVRRGTILRFQRE